MRRPDRPRPSYRDPTASSALARAEPDVVEVIPRDRSGHLPPWTPTPPLTGWTVSTAWAEAKAYAEEHAADGHGPEHRLRRAAFVALATSRPSLHKEWVIERMQGRDVTREISPGVPVADLGDDEKADLAAPF